MDMAGWNDEWAVAIAKFGRDDRVTVVTKAFKTEKARAAWIAKQEADPNFIEVRAYADPTQRTAG
jgi:hypothetical protein